MNVTDELREAGDIRVEMAECTERVGFWADVQHRAAIAGTVVNVALFVALMLNRHASKDQRARVIALYWAAFGVILLVDRFARVQKERAIDRHPLAYLIRMQQAFG